jgi:3' terminal RNA ribose 2'-O-methyltransferase Hen1
VGGGWLAGHPERELITTRYLAHKRRFTVEALARLTELDDRPTEDEDPAEPNAHDAAEERVPTLAEQRRGAIHTELRAAGATRVVDLGCGEGRLLRDLVADQAFTELVGVDVAAHPLRTAARWVERLPDRRRDRVRLLQGSVTYADNRLTGYDAIVLSEVVEHVDPPRLPALAAAVFGTARPAHVLMTTPNVEYNVRWETLPAGTVRHPDHRFEWTRAEFAAWAAEICAEHGYTVRHVPVGQVDPEVGAPTQLATFRRND